MNGDQSQTQHSQRSKNQSSSGPGKQSQRQAPTRPNVPGEDPGTLTDEDYLESGGPDAIDSAADVRPDAHPDSPPGSRRERKEDPERSGGAEDKSQSI
jgi:hypothetical protein